MELNATTLRTFLAAVMKVDEKYVVPRQGNWFNPQDMLPTAERPKTWCAYRIESNVPLTKPRYVDEDLDSDRVSAVVVNKIARVSLQFVGSDAERAASAVAFWSNREDVATLLEDFDGRLFLDQDGVRTSDFFQDGVNNVLAFNVGIRIVWGSVIVADQALVTSAVLEGEVI